VRLFILFGQVCAITNGTLRSGLKVKGRIRAEYSVMLAAILLIVVGTVSLMEMTRAQFFLA
jgi:hypothetical protein